MSDTAFEQGGPAATLTPQTVYEILGDPSLSSNARVVLALLQVPIMQHGFCAIFRDDVAKMLGCSASHAKSAIRELEHRQILISKLGGKGKPKRFTFGPAVALFGAAVSANVTVCGYFDSPQRSHSGQHDSQQTRFEFSDVIEPRARNVFSRSRATARSLRSLSDPGLNKSYDDDRAREAEASSSSFSEIKKRLREFGIADDRHARRLSRDLTVEQLEQHRPVILRMLALNGMTPATAVRLAIDFDTVTIGRWLDVLRWKTGVRDQGGYLAACLTRGHKPPAPVESQVRAATEEMLRSAVRSQPEKVKTDAEIRPPEPRALDPVAVERKNATRRVEEYFRGLPEAVRDDIETRAYRWAKKHLGENAGDIHRHEQLERLRLTREYAAAHGGPAL